MRSVSSWLIPFLRNSAEMFSADWAIFVDDDDGKMVRTETTETVVRLCPNDKQKKLISVLFLCVCVCVYHWDIHVVSLLFLFLLYKTIFCCPTTADLNYSS